jgi:hypothetical protein
MCRCGGIAPFLQHPLALYADRMLQSGAVSPSSLLPRRRGARSPLCRPRRVSTWPSVSPSPPPHSPASALAPTKLLMGLGAFYPVVIISMARKRARTPRTTTWLGRIVLTLLTRRWTGRVTPGKSAGTSWKGPWVPFSPVSCCSPATAPPGSYTSGARRHRGVGYPFSEALSLAGERRVSGSGLVLLARF